MAPTRIAPTVHQHQPITPDHDRAEQLLEEIETCSDARRRDRLRDEVVMLSLDLADTAAFRYRGRGIETDDLLQVARLALVKAVRGYRSGRGHSFAGYAVPTISGEIKRHFRDCGWAIRPPRRLQELRSRLSQEEERLRHELGREATLDELAEALSVRPRDIESARESAEGYHTLSLDLAMSEGTPTQVPTDRDPFTDLVEHDALVHALEELPERDRKIVDLRFGQEMTQSEIGQELGVSQMQVSRLLSSLLARLRVSLSLPDVDQQKQSRPSRDAARATARPAQVAMARVAHR